MYSVSKLSLNPSSSPSSIKLLLYLTVIFAAGFPPEKKEPSLGAPPSLPDHRSLEAKLLILLLMLVFLLIAYKSPAESPL
jgi:hypothetical protein